jgi:glyoxylase-like metal-dependent hydrolase (beta-lactamase superfamily II)
MTVLTLTLGPLATNCYLVWQDGRQEALLVDCAGTPEEITEVAAERSLRITLVANTHGHADHIEALAGLKQITSATVAIHELDAPMLSSPMLSGAAMFGYRLTSASADRLLREGDIVELDGTDIQLRVLHTPGHTPGSICLLGEGVLFPGDCLFAGGIGRVDLPGGDEQAMMRSLSRLTKLDPDLVVYPGHGPATTIGEERETNPWLEGL